ncbi:uncharacterized protein CDV56_104924 [Aspergillus thermomutatus]|uniref:BTB domain-containing protein n=1 Tax=Aspergillus thermomutatus TaxID=41047 RepID=A0A397H874_ASPTH|nr:uncharacterized protein CDV56_104924 [Aspergillus thermomutatus]RHZ59252.1 hypothetical protein CDV56_104924 [Aspergillus thermomutatus]
MVKSYHILDPEGDVILVFPQQDATDRVGKFILIDLTRENHPFEDSATVEAEIDSISTTVEGEWSELDGEKEGEDNVEEELRREAASLEPLAISRPPKNREVRVQVSSKHLSLASPVFHRMFRSWRKETENAHTNKRININKEIWDPHVVSILMNLIHGHMRKVPRHVSLEELAKFGVLVEYFECHEIAEVFTDMWVDHLKEEIPFSSPGDTMRWIRISWVFRKPAEFRAATRLAVMETKGPLAAQTLPIPRRILDRAAS